MERIRSVGRASSLWLAGALLVAGHALVAGRAAGQDTAQAAQNHAFEQALQECMASGHPLVIGLTADALPASRVLWREVLQTPSVQALARTTLFHELVAEHAPARAKQLGATALPSIFVVRKGPQGLELVARLAAPKDAQAVGSWLSVLGQIDPAAPSADSAVVQANHQHSHTTPSSQGYAPPPPPPSPPPTYQPTTVGTPMMGVPQQAVVVPTPSPSVYVQPQPPTIVVGAPAAANVVYTGSLGAPAMAAPTLGTPTLGVPANLGAQQPVAVGAAPVQVLPTQAPPMLGAAPSGQMVGLILERPGPARRLLAAFGRELSSLGNPRVRMSSMPEFAQIPIPTTQLGAAPTAPTGPIVIAHEPRDLPSPQDQHHKGLKKLFHHD